MSDKRLYYLTGTGNSLAIAKDLAAGLGSTAGECELRSMTKSSGPIEGDTVGLVFPVYFARPPVFVLEFIDNAVFGDVAYLFLVANGGGLFGTALKTLEAQLHRRGQTVEAGFLIGMPGNHPQVASIQRKAPQQHYAREKERIKEISGYVLAKVSRPMETNLGPLGWIVSNVAFRRPNRLSHAHRLDEALAVTDRCIGCGTCERVCRVGNIQLETSTGKPQWQHRCINCAACYHHCPQGAIEFAAVKHQMKRYRHPEVSLEEIMA